MKYFLIESDASLINKPELINWYKIIDKKSIDDGKYNKLDDKTAVYIKANKDTIFYDVVASPIFIVKKELKELISLFEPNLGYKQLILVDKENSQMEQYYIPELVRIDCLDKSTIYNIDKSVIKEGVIDTSKLLDKAIFRIKNIKTTNIVVRMDLLEAMLKRDYRGFTVRELKKV